MGAILSLYARPLVNFMHLSNLVQDYAVSYFRVCIQALFLTAITSSISSIFRSYGRPKHAVIVSLSRNILNVILDYLVIFQPIDLPFEGVYGIAIAYAISQLFSLILSVILLLKMNLNLDFKHKNLHTLAVTKTICSYVANAKVFSMYE